MNGPEKAKAIERLQKAQDGIFDLRIHNSQSLEFRKWLEETVLAIEYTFGKKSQQVSDFLRIKYEPDKKGYSLTRLAEYLAAYYVGLDSASHFLKSTINEIKEYWKNEKENPESSNKQENKSRLTNEIFIIHGRDEGIKNTVARFITELRLKPIILHEQPNQGRTIIEKFEQHSKVNFAIAILTPDDVGRLNEFSYSLKPRARQNVILEFGYFLGKLGRHRVCALVIESVEIPSDYSGVIYIPFDKSDTWKIKLIKELKTAGYTADANLVI